MRAQDQGSELSADQQLIASLGTKALMPVGNGKSLLELSIENLHAAGLTEVCLVIGPEHDTIRQHCASKNLSVSFAIQHEPTGTADAVLAAENLIESSELFLVVNSDNLYPVESLFRLRTICRPALLGFERDGLIANSNIPEERIKRFATIEVDHDESLKGIFEKPGHADPDLLVSMNAWLFSPRIFDACRAIELSERGEYEIAAAVQYAIDNFGERFAVVRSNEGVLDLSSRADIEGVRRFLEN